ncbi:hypothetical protein ACOJUR_00080 [Alicyclobacillus tolerans]|uniref:hypothetical protein n=1 Tax=Alicyclobacillus tolerans TaxID=90970 RepID=UPI003B7D74FF
MYLSQIDTLVAHVYIPTATQYFASFLRCLEEWERLSPYESMNGQFRDLEILTYPERTHGHWHAFQTPFPPLPECTQTVLLEFRIYDQEQKEDSHQWPVEVIYRSTACWTIPFPELWAFTLSVLQTIGDISIAKETFLSRISRIDLAIDTDQFQWHAEDRIKFVTRAKTNAQFILQAQPDEDDVDTTTSTLNTTSYHVGEQFTGFTFGKGNILCRIYNKWLEISQNHSYKNAKRFFADLWQEAGWDKTRDVWRIEFQLRRAALHQFKIPDTEITFAHADVPTGVQHIFSLLPYLLLEWITYREPNGNQNRSKWPMDTIWLHMAQTLTGYMPPSERKPLPPQYDATLLAKTLRGYLSAFAVASQISTSAELLETLPALLAHTLSLSQEELYSMLDTEIRRKAALTGCWL